MCDTSHKCRDLKAMPRLWLNHDGFLRQASREHSRLQRRSSTPAWVEESIPAISLRLTDFSAPNRFAGEQF
jgi:hypothetical protein